MVKFKRGEKEMYLSEVKERINKNSEDIEEFGKAIARLKIRIKVLEKQKEAKKE